MYQHLALGVGQHEETLPTDDVVQKQAGEELEIDGHYKIATKLGGYAHSLAGPVLQPHPLRHDKCGIARVRVAHKGAVNVVGGGPRCLKPGADALLLGGVGQGFARPAQVFIAVRPQNPYFVIVRVGLLVADELTQQWRLQHLVALLLVFGEQVLADQILGGQQLHVGPRRRQNRLRLAGDQIQERGHLIQGLALRCLLQLHVGCRAHAEQGNHDERDEENEQLGSEIQACDLIAAGARRCR